MKGISGLNLGKKMSISSSSIPGVSISKMKLGNLTKKVSEGLSSISMDTSNWKPNKAKTDAEDRKQEIAQALALIEEAKLQIPPSHAGLILVYSGKTMSPIVNSGLKFTWFRMTSDGEATPVDETFKSWYSPTVDDIGCMICVQCEDNFEQGCSKYLECGPIKADPLLKSVAEAAIEYDNYEAKEIFISLGLNEEETQSAPSDFPDSLNTVLSKEHSFLQFNGHSKVEVDENGIFISIPTLNPSETNNTTGIKGQVNQNKNKSKHSFNTSRRGLRIPASTALKITCVQPTSLILTLPIKAAVNSEPTETSTTPLEGEEPQKAANTNADDEKMRQFLNSSILAIPWTYEGHNLSPAAYISENESRLTPEEREKILKEAEEDSIIFANTVVSLTEFIASVPEGTDELLICFSCQDRLSRDALALSLRALSCTSNGSTRLDRRKILPWINEGEDNADNSLVAMEQESELDLKKRLKSMEEENSQLKRERNELTKQLLVVKEERNGLRSKGSGPSSGNEQTASNQVKTMESELDQENNLELSSKVIELENKLTILSKRESEASKVRDEIEQKNSKITIELEKYKKSSDEWQSKAVTIQTLYDRQSLFIHKLEENQVKTKLQIDDLEYKLLEMEKLREEINSKDQKIIALNNQNIEYLKKIEIINEIENSYKQQLTQLEEKKQSEINTLQSQLTLSQDQLSQSQALNNANLLQIQTLNQRIEDLHKFEQRAKDSETKSEKLAAEMNHLQKKADSLSKDLKKVLKDNAETVSEFEKALIRKSGECDECYYQVLELKEYINQLENNNANSSASAILSKLSTNISTSTSSITASLRNITTPDNLPAEDTSTPTPDGARRNSIAGSLFRRLSMKPSDDNMTASTDSTA